MFDDITFNDALDLNFENISSSVGEVPSVPLSAANSDLFRKPQPAKRPVSHLLKDKVPGFSLGNSNNVDSPRQKAVRRKFPGPAGLLPDKPPRSFQDASLILELSKETRDEDQILCSQTFLTTFDEPPYKRLKQDFGLDAAGSALKAVSVEWVKSKNLKGRKIPFMALVLESVDCSPIDPVLTLRDPTGALHGVLSSDLWKDVGHELKVGAALVLKEVGIINNIASSFLCLNITESNIVVVYTPGNDGDVTVKMKQPTNSADLALHVADWQAKAAQPSTPGRASLHDNKSRSIDLFRVQSPAKTSTPPNRAYWSTTASVAPEKPQPFRPVEYGSPSSTLHAASQESANFDLSMDNDFADFDENIVIPDERHQLLEDNGTKTPLNKSLHAAGALSQEEAQMVNEVLADLDFDDFD